ncbi:hypothetical protein O0I10_012821 [Lichtheimia ornata]|uniref:Uncharacterized protein n=1 Tax=Lichtheimia ornata TaxID=688661 RepID=A0AAD7USG8_9FUNG|nr:uncharacterized protein O0I10_012821 [Lichtheimia ornata]KAJ8651615.1 hypothetical protein O0I10_012821 [Lichtheimia ornata]
MSEMHELPREQRITIKQCAEDYCQEYGEDLKHVHDHMRYALKVGGRLWILAQAFEWRELVVFFPEISAKKFTDNLPDEFWGQVPGMITQAISSAHGDIATNWSTIYEKFDTQYQLIKDTE